MKAVFFKGSLMQKPKNIKQFTRLLRFSRIDAALAKDEGH